MGRESRGRGGRKDGAAKTEIHKDGEGTSEVLQWSRIQVTVMGVLTGVYLATMHRSLPGGDAGELIVAADELGVAHPPGYPLYTLLLKLSFLLVPNGTVALKANLLTAVMGAAAGGFLFQAGYLLVLYQQGFFSPLFIFRRSVLSDLWVLSLKLLVQISMCFLVGLLPYAYLPISALKDHEGQGLIQGLIAYGEHVAQDLTPLVAFLSAMILFSLYRSVVDRFVPLRKVKIDVVIALLISFLQLRTNLRSCDQSNNFVVHDFAMITLRAFPQGYFHVSEGVRPDLVIVDQEVLTYNWSIPMMGSHLKGIVFPGDQLYSHSGLSSQGRKLFTFRQLLDANYDRTVAGFHLLENADRVDEQEKKTAWLQEAYLIYKKAIESHPRVPAYWHKNFALVCEKLRHLSPKSDSLPLLKASIAHFKIYLDSDTTDPQRDAIQNAIQSLQTYVDHFEKDSGNGV
nr:hypothetical protein BaRGS_006900 [Batillaria attramentaria]